MKKIKFILALIFSLFVMLTSCKHDKKESFIKVADEIENVAVNDSIDEATGFVVDHGVKETIANCTNCHSAKLVTQNRMSKEGWINTIRWMQETQNLWNLGANEEIIVSYLAKNYAPNETGRRKELAEIDWYKLEEE